MSPAQLIVIVVLTSYAPILAVQWYRDLSSRS